MTARRIVFFAPCFALLCLLPFFEGGETSTGLFYFHTIVLLTFGAAGLIYSQIVVPRFLIYFLPFLLILFISTLLSEYKYSAFLRLWDYFIAGVWCSLACTIFAQEKKVRESSLIWVFIAVGTSTVLSVLIFDDEIARRINGSFVNANEFATFVLVLLCLGLDCLQLETNRRRQIIIATVGILLIAASALSRSRGIFLASLTISAAAFWKGHSGRTVKILLVFLLILSGFLVTIRLSKYDPVKYYRLKIWKSSLQGVAQDPYLGVGLGMLSYRAHMYNFPADTELARYGRIARSADSQYVEILAEIGFVGIFFFLLGWIVLSLFLHRLPQKYFYLKLSWIVLSVTSLFSIPLQNTSITFLFLFLVAVAFSESDQPTFTFGRRGRILIPVGAFLLFVFACFLPFEAHRQFNMAVKSKNPREANEHLNKAIRYNPYQPYYRFVFLRRVIDSNPNLSQTQWLRIIDLINQSININPIEYEFYLYKARAYRKLLLQKNSKLAYYSAVISSYQTALDYNPYNVFLRLEYASHLYQIKRPDLAEKEVRTALEHEPVFLNARLFLMELLYASDRKEEAKQEYTRFIKHYNQYKINAWEPAYTRSLLEVNEQQRKKIEQKLRET